MTRASPNDHATAEPTSENDLSFACPRCATTVRRRHRTYRCESCGFVPPHGAD